MPEKVKKWMTKDNLLVIILCGVLILVALWPMDRQRKAPEENTVQQYTAVTEETKPYREEMEKELQNMLKQMEGVGEVRVMITVKQEEVAGTNSSDSLWNNSRPSSVSTPKVEGMLVLAQGAGNAKVREDITETAKALFDVEANKVKVAILKTTGH